MQFSFTLHGGIEMPAIGYGTYKSTDGSDEHILQMALEAGYRLLDTAAFYGNERLIGTAVRQSGIPRAELFLTTKVWKTDLGYEATRISVLSSLERLQTGYLDLCLLHWPKPAPDTENWRELDRESWRALEELCRQGLIRALGVSNFLPHHLEALMSGAEIPPALDQLELHPGYMQEAAVQYCKAHHIQVQAWSPLGRRRVLEEPIVLHMAARYGVSPAQLLLRFLLDQDIAVIPKASTLGRMRENLELPAFHIDPADLSFLRCLPQMGWSGEHPDLPRSPLPG